MAQKLMLSACLAGIRCVYDGTHKRHPVFAKMLKEGKALVFCPEVLGGLKVPHPPSEILGGDGFAARKGLTRVVSKDGADVTSFFIRGARKSLVLARKNKITRAIMKSRSPSCGCGWVYDGRFSRSLVKGFGVTAALLKENGIRVVSDEAYLKSHHVTRHKSPVKTKTRNKYR